MKNLKNILTSSLMIIMLFSCKKSSTNNVNDVDVVLKSDAELLKLYNFSNTTVNGKITFEVKSTFLGQFNGLNLDFLGRFHTPAAMNQGSTSLSGISMKIYNENITPNNVLDYRKSYLLPNIITGNENTITLQAEGLSPILNHQFRIPKLVEFQNFELPANGIKKLKLNDVVGVKIDSDNKLGLMVIVTYDPYFFNDSLNAAGFTTEIRNVQIQEDDGAIELDLDIFAGIPNRCHYKLEIGRFNYELVTNTDGKKYAFYTLNSLGGYCKNF